MIHIIIRIDTNQRKTKNNIVHEHEHYVNGFNDCFTFFSSTFVILLFNCRPAWPSLYINYDQVKPCVSIVQNVCCNFIFVKMENDIVNAWSREKDHSLDPMWQYLSNIQSIAFRSVPYRSLLWYENCTLLFLSNAGKDIIFESNGTRWPSIWILSIKLLLIKYLRPISWIESRESLGHNIYRMIILSKQCNRNPLFSIKKSLIWRYLINWPQSICHTTIGCYFKWRVLNQFVANFWFNSKLVLLTRKVKSVDSGRFGINFDTFIWNSGRLIRLLNYLNNQECNWHDFNYSTDWRTEWINDC